MATIDYRPVRNYIRGLLIAGVSLDLDQYAWEDIIYDSQGQDVYIEEVIGIINEDRTHSINSGMLALFTYQVYSREGSSLHYKNEAEDLRKEVIDVFYNLHPFTTGGLTAYVQEQPTRRIATNNEGWRLSPVDIVIKIRT